MSSTRARCPHCGKPQALPSAGQEVPCASCQKLLIPTSPKRQRGEHKPEAPAPGRLPKPEAPAPGHASPKRQEVDVGERRDLNPSPERPRPDLIAPHPDEADDPRAIAQTLRPDVPSASSREAVEAEELFGPEAPVASPPQEAAPLGELGRFRLLAVLGQGSFGRVYRAYDPQLDREVALKVPRVTDDPEAVMRFLREAKAAGRLKHPNIVAVFETGRVGDSWYIAAEFVAGVPLAARLHGKPLLLRTAARIVRDLAEALDYAHSEGIVHRDLKPANIMLAADRRPQVMDFGLAKRVGDAAPSGDAGPSSDAGATREGSVVGTPAYMAPEQARGQHQAVGPHSDQYALGVILYELMTGQRPFNGPPHQILALVARRQPPSPRSRNPAIPVDLEAICLKAMAKKPEGRYASCSDLAGDLRRWLAGEPTQARPLSRLRQLGRWAVRYRLIAGLAAGLLLTTVLLLVGGMRLTLALREESQRATTSERLAQDNAARAEKAFRAEKEALAEKARTAGVEALKQSAHAAAADYDLQLLTARGLLDQGDVPAAHRLLDECPWTQRGWEHQWLVTQAGERGRALYGHTKPILSLAFTVDSKSLTTASEDQTVRLWDVATGAERVVYQGEATSVIWARFHNLLPDASRPGPRRRRSADGTLIAGVDRDRLVVRESATGKERFAVPAPLLFELTADDRGAISLLTLVENGASGPGLYEYDAASGRRTRTVHLEMVPSVRAMAVSPDNHWLALGTSEGMVWLLARRPREARLLRPPSAIAAKRPGDPDGIKQWVAVHPDGRRLAVVQPQQSGNYRVRIWDLAAEKDALVLDAPGGMRLECVAFSPDGQRIAAGGHEMVEGKGEVQAPFLPRLRQGTVVVWDASSGAEVRRLLGLEPKYTAAPPRWPGAIHDGRLPFAVEAIQEGSFRYLAFEHKSSLWALDEKASVAHWDLGSDKQLPITSDPVGQVGGDNGVQRAVFSGDGRRLATLAGPKGAADKAPTVRGWDLQTGRAKPLGQVEVRSVGALGLSHDGELLAVVEEGASGNKAAGSTIRLYHWDDPTRPLFCRGHRDRVTRLAFAEGGKRLISAGEDRTVRLWDCASGQELLVLDSSTSPGIVVFTRSRLAMIPGESKATQRGGPVADASGLCVWDAAAGVLPRTYPGHREGKTREVQTVAWSPDGRRIVSASGFELRAWDAVSGRDENVLAVNGLQRLTFAPDGKLLAGGFSGGVIVWDAESLRLRFCGDGRESDVAFSADGSGLASANVVGEVYLWDVKAGHAVRALGGSGPAAAHSSGHNLVAFRPDRRQVASAGGEDVPGQLKLWDLGTGKQVAEAEGLRNRAVKGLVWSPDSKYLITGNSDGLVRLHDPDKLTTVRQLRGHIGPVLAVAVAPRGKWLASAGSDMTVRLWDLATGKPGPVLRGHSGPVRDLAFHPDGSQLATASEDGTVKVWTLPFGQQGK